MNPHCETCIICTDDMRLPEARDLSERTGLTLVIGDGEPCPLQLRFTAERVELFDADLGTGIHVDFIAGALAHRLQYGGGRGQPLAKAVGLKRGVCPSLLDTTAGLARDAWVLASLGCTVTLVERSAVLCALIRDAVNRGLRREDGRSVLQNFMNVVYADAVVYMRHQLADTRPDVIYIDPMYPARSKSAAVKKDMQILQKLHGDSENNDELLETSLVTARKRVVVKRPLHAETLNTRAPSMAVRSRKTRYDVYMKEAF